MSILLSAAVALAPVPVADIPLDSDAVFVSAVARTAIAEGKVANLQCMQLPEESSDTPRVCLTSGEWQAVFDKVEKDRSVLARQRAINIAEFYAQGAGN